MFTSYTFKLKKQQQNINEEMKNVTKKKWMTWIYLPVCKEMHNFPEKKNLFIRENSVEKILRNERKK
jgi:hypothetical protein